MFGGSARGLSSLLRSRSNVVLSSSSQRLHHQQQRFLNVHEYQAMEVLRGMPLLATLLLFLFFFVKMRTRSAQLFRKHNVNDNCPKGGSASSVAEGRSG